jgi:hypothetical protein
MPFSDKSTIKSGSPHVVSVSNTALNIDSTADKKLFISLLARA